MVITLERAVKRDGYEAAVAKWEALLALLPDYKLDQDGALREWAMSEYTENNNHRHLSHLYPAWPAYETQNHPELAKAATQAVANRDQFNTADATAGHGWMHKALVYARLKQGDGVVASLLPMMTDAGYYTSFMTDHDTNRRCNSYCTDTLFGTLGVVNEALLYSNTGEIEVLPALPPDWTSGSIHGLMARTRAEVRELTWELSSGMVAITLHSSADHQEIILKSGVPWTHATVNGQEANAYDDGSGKYILVTLTRGNDVAVVFTRLS